MCVQHGILTRFFSDNKFLYSAENQRECPQGTQSTPFDCIAVASSWGTAASRITSITIAIVYSTVYSGADERKHQTSASLAFVWRIERWPVNSPHKGPMMRKMFPFDDVIMEWIFVRKWIHGSFVQDDFSLINCVHYDVTKWKHFPHYRPFVRGMHRSPRGEGVYFQQILAILIQFHHFFETNKKIWAKFDQCHAKLHRKWLIWWHLRLSRVWFWPIFRSQVYEFGPRSPQPRVWLRKYEPHTPVNFFGVREDVMFSLISHRWIPLIKVQWRGALMFSLMLAKTNCSTNRRVERHDVHFALPSKQL